MDNNNNMYQGEQNPPRTEYQSNTQPGGDVYQQAQYQYQQPYQPMPEMEEPVSMGEWVASLLMMCIPCVNVVLMFVWAFSKTEKKSKSNFFKAALICYGIIFAVMMVFWIIIIAAVAAAV